jgi:hypothetical protein
MLAITIMTFCDTMLFDIQGQSLQRKLLSPCFILKKEAEGIHDTLACNIKTTKTAHC